MASLERHAQPRKDGTESVAWRVRWADATTSRPVKKSFPTQEQAQAFLERVAPGEGHGSGLPHIAELRRPAQPADVDPLEEYLRWCAHLNLAATTIAQKRTHLRRLSHWLGEQSDHPGLLEVTGDHLRTWQLSLSGKAVQTRRSAATHARAFYRYAGDMELADHRLVGYLRIPHVPARLPRPISAVAADRRLHRRPGVRDRAAPGRGRRPARQHAHCPDPPRQGQQATRRAPRAAARRGATALRPALSGLAVPRPRPAAAAHRRPCHRVAGEPPREPLPPRDGQPVDVPRAAASLRDGGLPRQPRHPPHPGSTWALKSCHDRRLHSPRTGARR